MIRHPIETLRSLLEMGAATCCLESGEAALIVAQWDADAGLAERHMARIETLEREALAMAARCKVAEEQREIATESLKSYADGCAYFELTAKDALAAIEKVGA